MRACRVIAAALLSCAASGAAVTKASAWLSAHGRNPNQDDLAALKMADPMSYGIVKALLAKQQLGLLDPRHPMASTFGTAKSDSGEEHVYGAAAFAKFSGASAPAKRTEEPDLYAEAPAAPVHHDWMNWKPPTSAMGDEDGLVKSVLGGGSDAEAAPVAQAPEPVAHADRFPAPSSLDSDASLVSAEPAAAPVQVAAPEPVEQPAAAPEEPPAARPASQDNPYLQGIDFGAVGASDPAPAQEQAPRAAPVAAASAGNPYLQGIDFSEASTDTPAQAPSSLRGADAAPKRNLDLSTNSLSSFSWGEDADAAKAARPAAAAAPEDAPAPVQAQVTQDDAAANPLGEKLSHWLGAAMLQKSAKPVEKPKSSLDMWKHNIYMDDLQ